MSVHPERTSTLLPQLFQPTGPLTEELLLSPAEFGLGLTPAALQADALAGSVCGFCSTGCNLNVHLRNASAVGLTPSKDYPVNRGMACPKGWEALAALDAPDRATVPLLRNAAGRLEPVSWDTALCTFVDRIKAIQAAHGRHAVAFLSTGQIVTEEMALLGALAKFGMGMLHGDGNTRQCMATAVVAYKQAFGFDAPPYTYADFEESDVIVLVGSNLCIAHPILWQRVMRNPHRPEIVVIDPRATETAMAGTQHLPLYPKSDLTLLYGVARTLIERGWIDRDFIHARTAGFEQFAAFVEAFTPERVAKETLLPNEAVERLAATIHQGQRVSFWWTMGVNQSHQAVRTAQALINLALMTGNMGRPGTGANSITGQCNAMGSRLFSNTTNLLGGHDFACPAHRRKVADVLQIDEAVIPQEAGWHYQRIMEGILRREIRGLWVVATNPAHSWINQSMARDILDRLDFLVVQDMYHSTETAQRAHLVLPAAGWGEKEGTFINSERRIGFTSKVRKAPGQALADFHIFKLIADYWGCGPMFRQWESPAAVFQLLKRLSADQPCDITGIAGYETLIERGGVQWPLPAESSDVRQERRLFEDGQFYHADGRAKFICEPPRPLPEQPSEKYPLLLLTGRGTAAQWHTQTRTGKSAVLRKLYPHQLYVELSSQDATRLGIRTGDLVRVESQRGELRARAFVTPTVQPGQVFLPMHYEATNLLTDAVFDPYSHQPAYKACAVTVSL
ncbi:MAG: molybdopterin-dependent oxidoreductase [Planctomycetes bacterium]|nr:molybdopterin-dependent oxidoreductase [Planctomycetota bacterium]